MGILLSLLQLSLLSVYLLLVQTKTFLYITYKLKNNSFTYQRSTIYIRMIFLFFF